MTAPKVPMNDGAGMKYGSVAGVANGLHITAGNTTVRGLVINRFSNSGIFLNSGDGNIVQCNFIGTNLSGTAALSNGDDGLVIANGAASNLVGGTTAGTRNLISGNGVAGVVIGRTGVAAGPNNVVSGNYIGTNAAGTAPISNTFEGVLINDGSSNTLIGGTAAGAGNTRTDQLRRVRDDELAVDRVRLNGQRVVAGSPVDVGNNEVV